MNDIVGLSRRHFLKVSLISGGALLIGISSSGCDESPLTESAGSEPPGRFAPNAWIQLSPDSTATVLIGQAEMGQGVITSLAMLVAEELELPLSQITWEFAPADTAYNNPLFMLQATGGSTSIAGLFTPLRQAGATARQLLIEAAAKQWGVGVENCRAENGEVINSTNGQRLAYGGLLAEAAKLPVPNKVKLKDPAQFKLIGTPQNRLDGYQQVTGTAQYGIDVDVPNCLVATVIRPPVFGGRLKSFDDSQAKQLPGVKGIFAITQGLAVVAESYWQARQARAALKIEWDDGPNNQKDDAYIHQAFQALAHGEGSKVLNHGDAEAVLSQAKEVLDVAYELPYLAHATMEPMNATAHVTAEGCEIWAPTQNQAGTQGIAAMLTGFPESKVQVHTTHLGGGFGRRFETDFIVDAVEISQRMHAPVKVIWSREDDMRNDFYRPAMYHRLQAGFDGAGKVTAWHHRIVGPSIMVRVAHDSTPAILPEFLPNPLRHAMGDAAAGVAGWFNDPTAIEGAKELPYAFQNLRVEYAQFEDSFVPLGFWRSVAHSHNAFAVESFIDELAYKEGQDPIAYRLALLAEHPRHQRVLHLAAEKSDWNKSMPGGFGRGVALHASFGSIVAQVVEVSVSADGNLQVHRVVIVVDCGTVVNPRTVEAQMEGGMVYGLSAALHGAITIEKGGVRQGNFDTYPVLRMPEMPKVDVYIVPSQATSTGAGEPGTPPIAPALANAIFAATGKRLRKLPIDATVLRR